jgi:hypothetical protein
MRRRMIREIFGAVPLQPLQLPKVTIFFLQIFVKEIYASSEIEARDERPSP